MTQSVMQVINQRGSTSNTMTAAHASEANGRIGYACELFAEIDELRKLGPNWGTHNEPAVCKESCDRAEHFASYFCFFDPMLKLSPYLTAGGMVAIDFTFQNADYTVVFEKSGVSLIPDDDDAETKSFDNEFELVEHLRPRCND